MTAVSLLDRSSPRVSHRETPSDAEDFGRSRGGPEYDARRCDSKWESGVFRALDRFASEGTT
jgi:hypothetical protein